MHTRLLQVFLSTSKTPPNPGIFEVSATMSTELKEGGRLICTCPGFTTKGSCKHERFVKDRTLKNKKNPGVYPTEISSSATEKDYEDSKKSLENFREFVLKFGKVEIY